MKYRFTIRCNLASCVLAGLLLAVSLPLASAQVDEGTAKTQLTFHNTNVALKSIQHSGEEKSDPSRESQKELDALSEQKQTAEAQLNYAKTKLEAARRQLRVQVAAGNVELTDRAQQNIKDWEARVKTAEAQMAQVDSELQSVIQGIQPPANDGPQGDILLPGETVEVFVNEDNSFNGRYLIRRGGYIIVNGVGRINVAGKGLRTAETTLKRALEASQLQHATVMIEKVEGSDVESGPLIYLSGEFKQPRPFRIPAGTKSTLISVILSSGGYTERADLTRVKVMRVAANKGVVEEVNVQRMLDGGGLTSDLALNAGDVITIPATSLNTVFVTGKVTHQGSIILKPGDKLTAYAAILRSGGFARFADKKKVYILRATPDGTKIRIPVDVEAIQKGKAPDVSLQEGDIIVVPEKFWSFGT